MPTGFSAPYPMPRLDTPPESDLPETAAQPGLLTRVQAALTRLLSGEMPGDVMIRPNAAPSP